LAHLEAINGTLRVCDVLRISEKLEEWNIIKLYNLPLRRSDPIEGRGQRQWLFFSQQYGIISQSWGGLHKHHISIRKNTIAFVTENLSHLHCIIEKHQGAFKNNDVFVFVVYHRL